MSQVGLPPDKWGHQQHGMLKGGHGTRQEGSYYHGPCCRIDLPRTLAHSEFVEASASVRHLTHYVKNKCKRPRGRKTHNERRLCFCSVGREHPSQLRANFSPWTEKPSPLQAGLGQEQRKKGKMLHKAQYGVQSRAAEAQQVSMKNDGVMVQTLVKRDDPAKVRERVNFLVKQVEVQGRALKFYQF